MHDADTILSYTTGGARRKARLIFFVSASLTLAAFFAVITVKPDILENAWNGIVALVHHGPDAKIHTGPTHDSNLKSALETFENDNGRYPTTEEGLGALVNRPPGVGSNWHRLLDHVPTDQWGHDFKYTCPGIHDPKSFDLDSAGPDGIFGTADDIHKDTRP